ncbi:hypothetical protein [Pseudomonas aeruginosa]|uniref:hypothetical protein n=1 Tax=Pseudomonas aeruginosa TaxID=287 RepID=UPI003CC5CF31|nr:hypothetical protein [Pseudomonas aeruginosa]
MTASNIERFDEITGLVLGKLYENFPVPIYLLVKNFVDDGYKMNEALGVETITKDGEFLLASISWLASSGYLLYEERIHHQGFRGAVLTAKGLEVLKAMPASLQVGPSLGEKLVVASKVGTKEVLRGVVSEVLSMGARYASVQLGLPT